MWHVADNRAGRMLKSAMYPNESEFREELGNVCIS
jgi:hypothetical protein